MKLKPWLCFLAAFASTLVLADEPADTIRTGGRGDLAKVSDFLLFSTSKKFAVLIPVQISAGDSLIIQYAADGKSVREKFTVVDIAIRGDLCWLYSKKRSSGDASIDDMIYVQPCARMR